MGPYDQLMSNNGDFSSMIKTHVKETKGNMVVMVTFLFTREIAENKEEKETKVAAKEEKAEVKVKNKII